MKSLTFNKQS